MAKVLDLKDISRLLRALDPSKADAFDEGIAGIRALASGLIRLRGNFEVPIDADAERVADLVRSHYPGFEEPLDLGLVDLAMLAAGTISRELDILFDVIENDAPDFGGTRAFFRLRHSGHTPPPIFNELALDPTGDWEGGEDDAKLHRVTIDGNLYGAFHDEDDVDDSPIVVAARAEGRRVDVIPPLD